MIKECIKSPVYSVPSPSIEKGTITEKLIELVEKVLIEFQDNFKNHLTDSEDVLTEGLSNTLSHFAKPFPFIIKSEAIQKQPKGQSRYVDIGIFLHYRDDAPFFTIEAKRLPTLPKSTREKEYVLGNDPEKPSGGIERYKLNLHGVNLHKSGMVAYIQSGTCEDWHNQINEWIAIQAACESNNQLKWDHNDLLITEKDLSSKICVLSSINKKNDNTSIKLFHFFIDLS